MWSWFGSLKFNAGYLQKEINYVVDVAVEKAEAPSRCFPSG